MALYLNNDKIKINLDGKLYNLNIYSTTTIVKDMKLLSLDGYILTDSNGLHLVTKESE